MMRSDVGCFFIFVYVRINSRLDRVHLIRDFLWEGSAAANPFCI